VNAAGHQEAHPPHKAVPEGLVTSFSLDNLYNLRAEVAAHASNLGLAEPQLRHLLVVATELATNVVRHGGGTGKLRLWRSGEAIVCEVSDDGPGIAMPHQVGTKPVPLNYDGGRGLWLVRHFTDSMEIVNRRPGTTVTVTMTIR